MKPFAEAFYNSKAWRDTRKAYSKSVGGLCERCKEKGLYNAGEIVHHKTHLTPQNINNANVTLSWSNLQLLCRDCHAEAHKGEEKRYVFDENGNIAPLAAKY